MIATASSFTAIETAIQVELVTSGEERGSVTNASARSSGKPARTANTAAVAPTPTPVTRTASSDTSQNSTACSRVGISLLGESGARVTVAIGCDSLAPPASNRTRQRLRPSRLGRVSSNDDRKGLKFSFVLLCLLGIGGCSSGENDADPNATVRGFCENWGKAACSSAVVVACSGAEKATATLTDACISSQQAFCEGLLPAQGYSPQRAAQCLDAVQRAYNDAQLTPLEIATVRHRGDPCNHLIKGAQAEGESCLSDDDCDTLKNYLCVFKSGEGTCQIPTVVDAGKSCSAPGAACAVGYYCGVDEACVQSKSSGDKCTASFQCGTGLECNADTEKCVTRVNPDSCAKDDDCATNVCDVPVGASTGRCVARITLAASTGLCEDLR